MSGRGKLGRKILRIERMRGSADAASLEERISLVVMRFSASGTRDESRYYEHKIRHGLYARVHSRPRPGIFSIGRYRISSERERKMKKYGLLPALVLIFCTLLLGTPGSGILFCQEQQLPQASGPLGLESVKPEVAPFFRMLSECNLQIRYRITSDFLYLGTNLVRHLSSACEQDFMLGKDATTISTPYKGGPVSEGPKMRIMRTNEIDSLLSSKYFTYISKHCASGTVHAATKKEIEILHKDYMFFAGNVGCTVVVESGGVSIAYGFDDKGYLSWIDSFPTKKKKK